MSIFVLYGTGNVNFSQYPQTLNQVPLKCLEYVTSAAWFLAIHV